MVEGAENDLVQRAKNGDWAALEELLVQNHRKVYGTISRMLQGNNDVEDLWHNVFVKVRRSISSFDGRSQFSTWLCRIAINECLDYFKNPHSKRLEPLDGPEIPQDNGADSEDFGEERGFRGPSPNVYSRHLADENEKPYLDIVRQVVEQVRDEMGPLKAEVVELYHIDGLTASETADTLGLEKPEVVYEIARECRKRFRRALAEALAPRKKYNSGVTVP